MVNLVVNFSQVQKRPDLNVDLKNEILSSWATYLPLAVLDESLISQKSRIYTFLRSTFFGCHILKATPYCDCLAAIGAYFSP